MKFITLTVSKAHTNCYILFDQVARRAVVIDPGDSGEQIKATLEENGLALDKILLTHGHWDHIWAVDELMADGVEFIMHKADLPYLTHDMNKPLSIAGFDAQPISATPTRFVEDGDTIPCDGFDIGVMHTPGHTPGSVLFFVENHVFTGDFLFAGSIGRYDFPGGNREAMHESLRKVAAITQDYAVHPGHMGSTTLAHEQANNPHIARVGE
ncbi:MAG: MBL fold metallo-hydrolase [Oscillospiraceae bacterium]|nr:MBL fold metallo-hydrolase [Oscillospiraceae bacterium]